MEACPGEKRIFQDRQAMLAKDLQRIDVYERRDDHDGKHCDDCCLYSKVGKNTLHCHNLWFLNETALV